jgi:ATP-dependent DNA ligase
MLESPPSTPPAICPGPSALLSKCWADREQDLRATPIELRKRKLAQLLNAVGPGLQLSEHLHGDGAEIFAYACELGCEGIGSKRLGSRYVSGRSLNWIKVKNPAAPAMKREAEEDWSARR